MFAAEINAEEEFAGVSGDRVDGGELRGVGRFAGLDQFVGEKNGGLVEELAFVFLGPGIGIENALLEDVEIQREILRECVVDGDLVFGEGGGFVPKFVKEITLAVGRADDAELFGAAAQVVGDGGKDRLPDFLRVIVKRELGEDDIGGITANG